MKHIRRLSAVLIAILLLFAVLVLLGSNGVREVAWIAREVSDLPRSVVEDALRVADVMAEDEGCEALAAYEGREQVVRLETEGTLSLNVTAPEAGEYRLLVGYHTLEGKGIDMEFTYHADWDYMTFGEDAKNSYLFCLTEGKHTLRMQVTLGDMAPLLEEMQDTVYGLSELYRQIIMITGTEPDFYRDYYLEKVIPNQEERLNTLVDTLDGYQERMDALLGSHSTAGQTIQVLSCQMREFAKEPYTIQKRLTTFSSNISAFAEWTLSVREQPLEIDYFVLSDPAAATRPGTIASSTPSSVK